MRRLSITKQVGILLVLFFLFYLGFSAYLANRLTSGYPKKITTSPTTISSRYETIAFPATDGITLRGWFFPGTSDKAIILVHGITQDRVDADYDAIDITKDLLTNGYSVLLYDSRGHGESDGARAGFGKVGGRDIIGAVSFLQTKGYTPQHIGIIADSNGAISLLTVLDQLPTVGAIVSDSAAAQYLPVMANVLTNEYHIPKIFDPGIFFMSKILFRVDFASINPVENVKSASNRKILFLHGSNDDTIPVQNAYELQAADPNSELVIFPGARHVGTYKSNPQLYRQTVFQFLQQQLTE